MHSVGNFMLFSRSVASNSLQPMDCSTQALLSSSFSQSLIKLTSIESMMPSNHLILCCPLSSRFQSFPASGSFPVSWLFSISGQNIGASGFSLSLSNEYLGLISFQTDQLDILAVQGTLKNLLQHHSLKASILWHSGFSVAQLSHPYMITGKTIALTRQTFVGKVMSLLFNVLSRFVIAFLPWSKHL